METAKPQGITAPQVCDLCDCASHQVFRTRGRGDSHLATVICQNCGLVYSNPRPSEEENADFYHHRYWDAYKGKNEADDSFFNRRLPKIKSMLQEVTPLLKPGVKLLEIGCGVGALLWSIKNTCNGLGEFVGVEPHSGHARFAREQKELNVHNGLLEEVYGKLAKSEFDVIIMNHVLEHTISPTGTFAKLKELLKPNGTLVIEVPNVEAPGSRLSHYFHIAHHFAFSPKTLQRLGTKGGFRIVKIEALDGDLPGTRLLGVFQKVKSLKPDLPLKFIRDDPDARADALEQYERWYWTTLASLRKKITHWKRQRN